MSRHSSKRREFAEIERRMQRLERRLEGLGSVAARTAASGFASAAQATDRVGDALVSALGDLVDRFRGGARTSAAKQRGSGRKRPASATRRASSATSRCGGLRPRSSTAR